MSVCDLDSPGSGVFKTGFVPYQKLQDGEIFLKGKGREKREGKPNEERTYRDERKGREERDKREREREETEQR